MKIRHIILTATIFSGIASAATAQEPLTAEKLWQLGRVSDVQVSPNGQTILYGISYYNTEENRGNRDIYSLDKNAESPRQLTSYKGSEFNAVWRPDGKKIGFIATEGGSAQLWEMDPTGSNKEKISNIEGGISGFAYAPDMSKILYIQRVKLDKTVQDRYQDLPKADARIIDDLMYRHWDAWSDYHYNHIFVASYERGRIGQGTDIMEGETFDSPMNPWGGMEQITWSPDSKSIAYACKKKSGKAYAESTDSEIYRYTLDDAKTVNISSPGYDGYDHDPVFSPNGDQIVWKSMARPGFEADKERIIVHNFNTGTTVDLTKGFDQSCKNFVWNEKGDKLYFISGIHATYQIYEMSLKKRHYGEIRQITQGTHDYTSFQLAGDRIIATRMSMSAPTEIFEINAKGDQTQLTFTNRKLLKTIKMGRVEERWINTTDGKKMLSWVIYPPNFDPNKKYPTILYCQGGPQSAVSQFFSYRWNFQMMAAHDYIIVAPNRRGLPTFGQQWNDDISLDYTGQCMEDYLSAIDEVAKEPYVDQEKLGCVGASFGGFSVYWLAGHHQKRFKAFISHCGMFNLESWYGSTEESWFPNHDLGGNYWQKNRPESYKNSPHHFVDQWDTPIMVIVGGNDFRIPYTESLQAFNVAQMRGIPSRLLFFPEESHFVLKPQNSILWQREFFRWLDQWLKN